MGIIDKIEYYVKPNTKEFVNLIKAVIITHRKYVFR